MSASWRARRPSPAGALAEPRQRLPTHIIDRIMLLIIFGAGASHDSWSDKGAEDKSGRIPLADDLFDVEFAQYVLKEMRPILPLLRTRPAGTTVEHRLEELQSEVGVYETRARQLMAVRLYLSRMLTAVEAAWVKETGAVSNYRTLVDELRLLLPSEPVAFVTFNYDTLLERAITSDTTRTFPEVSDYVKEAEAWNVYKLHGSLGWSRRVDVSNGADLLSTPRSRVLAAREGLLMSLAPSLKLAPEWTKARLEPRELAVPALAVPFESKQDFECPPNQIEQLRGTLPRVDRILSIGWRATDQPFLQLIRDLAVNVRTVECVTMRNPSEPLERLVAVLPAGINATPYQGGFSKYIVGREIKRTLARPVI